MTIRSRIVAISLLLVSLSPARVAATLGSEMDRQEIRAISAVVSVDVRPFGGEGGIARDSGRPNHDGSGPVPPNIARNDGSPLVDDFASISYPRSAAHPCRPHAERLPYDATAPPVSR